VNLRQLIDPDLSRNNLSPAGCVSIRHMFDLVTTTDDPLPPLVCALRPQDSGRKPQPGPARLGLQAQGGTALRELCGDSHNRGSGGPQ